MELSVTKIIRESYRMGTLKSEVNRYKKVHCINSETGGITYKICEKENVICTLTNKNEADNLLQHLNS